MISNQFSIRESQTGNIMAKSGWEKWNGDKLKKLTAQATGDALYEAAEATLGVSNQQVPLDEGTLESTGLVIRNPNNPLDVIISYGGGPGTGFSIVPYARRWHEVSADFQGEGRKKNYLRDPIKNFAPEAVRKRLIKAAKEVW